jgi:hypothetical protein
MDPPKADRKRMKNSINAIRKHSIVIRGFLKLSHQRISGQLLKYGFHPKTSKT